MKKILYATTNPGKLTEISIFLAGHGHHVLGPKDLGRVVEVEEDGQTLQDNALKKALAYLPFVDEQTIIIGDDTGVSIDALNGEPGIFVRRWADHVHHMTDQEIIDYCLLRLHDVPYEKRTAKMQTQLAIVQKSHAPQQVTGELSGHILEHQDEAQMEGFPFEALFYADQYKLMLWEIHKLTMTEKLSKGILTHREKALTNALQFLA